jgi:autotransporter-associated beta strand protein
MKHHKLITNHFTAAALGLSVACGLIGSPLSALSADVVNDTWIDGNRNQPASPTYSENGTDADADGNIESAWFNSGGATWTMTVVDDAVPGGNQLLRKNVNPAGAVSWATYFTPEASPVTLVNPGDQMVITWVFSLTGVNAASTGQGFRIAVVNSPAASRITAEATPGNSTYAGYAVFGNMRSGTLGNGNSFAIMERTDNATSAALLSASAAWTLRANGADTAAPGYTDNTPYTLTMTFTRTVANEIDVSATITGTGLGVDGNGLAVNFVDDSPNSFTFDTFNVRPQTGNDTATTFDTSLFRVQYTAACVSASVVTDPVNKTVAEGQTASFSVVAGGASPTYQWQVSTDDGETWNAATGTGATTANYTTLATTGADDGNQYRCLIEVGCDSTSAISAAATLSITVPKNLTWVGDGTANLWDTATANWTGDATIFTDTDNVTFNNSGSATPAIDLVGVISPNLITVNSSQNYTIGSTSGGSLGGAASLTKSGFGTLTLTTVNSFTGKTTVNGGSVSIATASHLGAAPAVFTADQLTLNGGTIQYTASGSIAANRGTTLGNAGGTFDIPAGVDFVNTPITTGPGSLTKIGDGSLALNVANTHAGGTILSNGTVNLGNASGAGTGLITLAGGTLHFPGATAIGNSVNVIADSTLTFASTGNNAVGLNGPALTGAAGKTLTITPTGASTANTRVRINNGLTNNLTFNANLVLNGTFTFATYNNVGDETFTGVISGSGILGRRSPLAGVSGNTILTGDNTYSGGTVIADGGIGFGIDSTGQPVTSGPIGTGPLSFENNPNTGKRLYAVGGPRTVGNAITWPAGVNQALTLDGNFNLNLTGDMDLGDDVRTIAITSGGGVTHTLGGNISNGSLLKNGDGLLHLNGTAALTTLTVDAGTLGGTGTINGATTVNATGTLSPGSTGIGTLTINGDLTLAGNTVIEINKPSVLKDFVTGVATLNFGGTLTVVDEGGGLQAGDSFAVFSASNPQGNFASIAGSPGAGLAWSFNPATGILSVVADVGQPTLNVAQTGNALEFTWSGAFKLQAQTNSLSTGLSGNWGDYPGGNSSPVNVTIDPAQGTVFFRLINQ